MITKIEIQKVFTDGNLMRIMAVLVLLLLSASLLTHSFALLVLIASDFAIRTFTYKPSPLILVSKVAVRFFKLKPKPVFAAPERFTAALFLVLTLAVILFFGLEMNTTATVIGLVFAIFTLREAIFNVCLGYYLYYWFFAPIIDWLTY